MCKWVSCNHGDKCTQRRKNEEGEENEEKIYERKLMPIIYITHTHTLYVYCIVIVSDYILAPSLTVYFRAMHTSF